MAKRDTWRQATPLDQYLALLMAVDGSLDCVKNGLNAKKHLILLESFVVEMRELYPFLCKGSW